MKTNQSSQNRFRGGLPAGNRSRFDLELFAFIALFSVAVVMLLGCLMQSDISPATSHEARATNAPVLAVTPAPVTNLTQDSNGSATLPQNNS